MDNVIVNIVEENVIGNYEVNNIIYEFLKSIFGL